MKRILTRVRRWGARAGGGLVGLALAGGGLVGLALILAVLGGLGVLASWFEGATGVTRTYWGALMLWGVLASPVLLFVLAPLLTGAAAWRELAKACRAPRPRAFLALLAFALVALPFAPFAFSDRPLWPSAGIVVLLEAFIVALVLTAWGWLLETESHPRSY